MLRRLLSWLWPQPGSLAAGRFGTLEVRWEQGRKVLNSANGNQSFGSLHRVWQQTLSRVLGTDPAPRSILLLGLGGGSVPTILRNERGIMAPILAVELDPTMVELGKVHFGLGSHTGLRVILGDATIQVHAMKERFDMVLVDLFDDLDLARGVDSRSFLHGLRDRCADGGVVCFNTVAYDETSDRRCQTVLDHARRVFHTVEELRLEGFNRMFIAR